MSQEPYNTIFDGRQPGEHICISWKKHGKGWETYSLDDVADQLEVPEGALEPRKIYFMVATVGGDGTSRKRKDIIAVYQILVDDAGTKVPMRDDSNYIMETSEANNQLGYLIERCTDLELYEAVVKVMGEKGLSDKGAGGAYRLCRIPGSVHDSGFRAKLTWKHNKRWKLLDLAHHFGITDEEIEAAKRSTRKNRPSVQVCGKVDDVVLAWLSEQGQVIKDDGEGDWVDIKCPNAKEHTDGNEIAGYSPLGRGGKWAVNRSFKCMHQHCQDIDSEAFLAGVAAQGGPNALAYDPITFLQIRYAVVADEQKIVDLEQKRFGGKWLWTPQEFAFIHPGKIKVDGGYKVKVANAFIDHPDTKRYETTTYWPTEKSEVVEHGRVCLNTWAPPMHSYTEEEPALFLEHVEYLLPNAHDLLLDWLAHKVQHPDERSYAFILAATGDQGVGRSMLFDMLRRVYRDTSTVSMGDFLGVGSQFNGWELGKQMVFVEETKALPDRVDKWSVYETMKERIDTRPTPFECNQKYGASIQAMRWYNVLMATNHRDSISLPATFTPEEERRTQVEYCPEKRRDPSYYARLLEGWDANEAARVYHWLMRRDVSQRAVWPTMTQAKLDLLTATQSPTDEAMEHLRENAPGDVITRKAFTAAYEKTMQELDIVMNDLSKSRVIQHAWKHLDRLGTGRSGLRPRVADGRRIEVRALRNRAKWQRASEAEALKEAEKNGQNVFGRDNIRPVS
jgi:hypothetical protein